jgi:hypothetical protein
MKSLFRIVLSIVALGIGSQLVLFFVGFFYWLRRQLTHGDRVSRDVPRI